MPLVVANPRVWPEGRTTEALASAVDVLPTLLSLAGVSPPDDLPPLRGRDLSPVLFGERPSVQDAVLFATDDDILEGVPLPGRRFQVPQPKSLRALRTQRWKLVRCQDPAGRVHPSTSCTTSTRIRPRSTTWRRPLAPRIPSSLRCRNSSTT